MDIFDVMGVSKLSAKVFLNVNYSFSYILFILQDSPKITQMTELKQLQTLRFFKKDFQKLSRKQKNSDNTISYSDRTA